MKVRGITVLTRKNIVIRRFGTEAWLQLYRDVAASHPCFRSLVTPDSLLPLPAYLTLHDELIRRMYRDNAASNVELGRESARWALSEGPCKSALERRDLGGFVGSFPKLWSLYFADTSSRSEAGVTTEAVEFKVYDLPQWHPYLEHFIMGFNAEILESFCANPIGIARLRGGGKNYHYLLQTADDLAHQQGTDEVPPARPAPRKPTLPRQLSNREIEVLMLVAEGKTNEEIGIVLGISGKTVQHHVAHIYRKIDVSSRVGAALWLSQWGLIGN